MQKGKVSITPPVSPSATSNYSFSSENAGFNNASWQTLQRQVSDDNSEGIDGHFRFLENLTPEYPSVFTISNGNTDTLKSNVEKSAKTGYDNGGFDTMGSNFSEDKYKWTDTDDQTNADTRNKKTNTRKVCVTVLVTLLILSLAAGIAVIIAWKVFGVWGKSLYYNYVKFVRAKRSAQL